MYSRYPNYRFSGGVRVPENYSGNAFTASAEVKEDVKADQPPVIAEEPQTVSVPVDNITPDDTDEKKEESQTEREVFKPMKKGIRFPGFGFDIGKIFSGRFGFEELLIIALILLISQNGADDDIILMLALLLFIG